MNGRGKATPANLFLLAHHFKGKPQGKLLYENFKQAIKKQIGTFKIESLECCIHFVTTFTFELAKIFKDKIEVHFGLGRKIKNKRINKCTRLSAHRYLYYVNIYTPDEMDDTLM